MTQLRRDDALEDAAGMRITPELQRWLAPRTDVDGDCWIWTGFCNNGGRSPSCSVGGERGKSARTWVWQQVNPRAPFDHRRHAIVTTCRHTKCLNPLHLLKMTRADALSWFAEAGAYMTPRSRRARQVNGRKQSRITPEIAAQIRSERAAGATISELARRFPGCRSTMRKICNGQSFAEVGVPFSQLLRLAA